MWWVALSRLQTRGLAICLWRHAAGCAQVTLVTKGLVDREAKLRKTTEDLWQQAVAANQELTCFRALAANEVTALSSTRPTASSCGSGRCAGQLSLMHQAVDCCLSISSAISYLDCGTSLLLNQADTGFACCRRLRRCAGRMRLQERWRPSRHGRSSCNKDTRTFSLHARKCGPWQQWRRQLQSQWLWCERI